MKTYPHRIRVQQLVSLLGQTLVTVLCLLTVCFNTTAGTNTHDKLNERQPVAPNIGVSRSGTGYDVATTTFIGFPAAAVTPSTLSFVIANTGDAVLSLGSLQIGGMNAADFGTSQPASPLAPGASTTFTITFTPSGNGARSAQLTIPSNDPDTNPFIINLVGAGADFYGPKSQPPGIVAQSSNGNEAGRAGGRTLYITGVSLAERTSTYWGPQINSQGELQLKLSLDGGSYTGREIFTYDPSLSNQANGVVSWKAETKIQNAINGGIFTVYARAWLTTKRLDNSVVPLFNPLSVGLSEQVGGVVPINSVSDYLVANYYIEASTSPNGPFQPYLDFYDAYPTPAGPLPGQGIGNAYSSITNGFYWTNLPPRLTTNNVLSVDEGGAATITTAFLNATDEDEAPLDPQSLVFEFKTEGPSSNPMGFGVGLLKNNGVVMTKDDVFTLKDIIDGKISYQHDGSESTYDEFQFSLKDKKGAYAVDGGHTVYSFKVGVNPINDPPFVVDQVYHQSYALPIYDSLVGFDPEGDHLTFEIVTQPLNGYVTLTEKYYHLYPNGLSPGVYSFTFRVNDGTFDSNEANVTYLLENLPPIVQDQADTTTEGSTVSNQLYATDPESSEITFAVVSPPAHGAVTIDTAGYHYTPAANFFGDDVFTFSATDAQGFPSQAVVRIHVRPLLQSGDLLYGDDAKIVLVDPVHGQDAVIFQGGYLQGVQQVVYQEGQRLFALDHNAGLVSIDPANGNQTVLLSAASFSANPGPLGMIENTNGDLIITDGPNGIRKVVTATNQITTLFSGGSLILPAGIVQHPDGSYIISDAGAFAGQSSKVIKIAADGTQTVISQGGSLKIPVDIQLIDANTAIVNDAGSLAGGADAIISVDLTTGVQTVVSTGGQLGFPSGGAFDPSTSKFYAINKGNGSLLDINVATGVQTALTLQTPVTNPFGLSIISGLQSQSITFTLPSNKMYGNAAFALNGAASSGLPVQYASSDHAVATVTGNVLTIVGAGSVTITASQPGNLNYIPAVPVQQTLHVSKALLTITADNKSVLYGTTQATINGLTLTKSISGFVNGDNVSALDSMPTLFVDGSIKIRKGSQFPSVGTYEIITFVGLNTIPQPAPENAWTIINSATLVDGFDNNYAYQLVPGNIIITKATLTISADSKTKVYGSDNPALTMSYTGFKGTETEAVLQAIPSISTAAIQYSPPGAYPIVLAGGSAPDYDITLVNGTLTVVGSLPNVYVTSPGNNATNQNLSLNVTAKAVTGATTYTIQLSEFVDFSVVAFEKAGTRTQAFSGLKYNTVYYNRVKTDLSPLFGAVKNFKTKSAASISYVLTPGNNSINQSITPSVKANLVPGASSYTIQLSEFADFSVVAFEQTGATQTLAFSGLKYNTLYFDRVKTDLSDDFGAVRNFRTKTAESISYVTLPGNNAVNQSITLNVKSNTVPGASTYTIQLSEFSDFSVIAFEKSGGQTLAFTGLKYGTVYYNRVKTDLSSGFGVTKQFTTKTAESISYVITPSNGATGQNVSLNVKSNTVPGALLYTIQLSTSSNFSSIAFELTSPTQTQTFNGLSYSTVYYNRVKTDLSPNFGAVRSFTTKAAPAGARIATPDASTAMLDIEDAEVQVFPNPFSEKLTVFVKTAAREDVLIKLFDLTGKEIYNAGHRTNEAVEIETQAPAGIYILKATTRFGSHVMKVAKQ